MTGDDEARARAALMAMLDRLSKGPHMALGVTHTATHEQVRTAFLQLTKKFHPAKFARMSTDLQRLANEVFLQIRTAHDTLASGSSLRGQPAKRPSGAFAPVASEPSGSMRPTGAQPPLQRPAATSPQPTSPPRAQGTGPAPNLNANNHPAARPPTPVQGQPPLPKATPQQTPIARPPQPAQTPPTQPQGVRSTATMPVLDPTLQQVYEQLKQQNWSAARQTLNTLLNKDPQSKKLKALLCYARGRESHIAGRADEARIEYARALELDPDLQLAKQATVELLRRR